MRIVAQIAALALTFVFIQALLFKYRRYRQKSTDGQVWFSYKARLPQWLKTAEKLIAYTLWFGMSFGLFFLSLDVYPKAHPGKPSLLALGIMVIADLSFAIFPAFLLANIVSWLVPAMRRANLRTLEGTSVSFGSANAGLVKGAIVIMPIALAAIVIAMWLP